MASICQENTHHSSSFWLGFIMEYNAKSMNCILIFLKEYTLCLTFHMFEWRNTCYIQEGKLCLYSYTQRGFHAPSRTSTHGRIHKGKLQCNLQTKGIFTDILQQYHVARCLPWVLLVKFHHILIRFMENQFFIPPVKLGCCARILSCIKVPCCESELLI